MGAKNAVFPADEQLSAYLGKKELKGVWADPDAPYAKVYDIVLSHLYPLAACPHHVDHVKSIDEIAGTRINQALIGTCTNGRLEDLRVAAAILKGKKVSRDVQLLITPASRDIYLQAVREGLAAVFLDAGANLLTPSCGPCLGTGQGIPADGINVISTANRNFLGRMGNPKSSIYLASPATVAISAVHGEITSPATTRKPAKFPFRIEQSASITVDASDDRYVNGVWNYADADNLNTDQMFAGNLTYEINSAQPEKIAPHLFRGFDGKFADLVQSGDIIVCGENFGCGSSREHPAVGLVYKGIRAVLVKSVSRIFFRSAINQGLPVLVVPEAVNAYRQGDRVTVDMAAGSVTVAGKTFTFNQLPDKLLQILERGGLVKTMLDE
jgi:3-isopropylmalate dehydratase small subunit